MAEVMTTAELNSKIDEKVAELTAEKEQAWAVVVQLHDAGHDIVAAAQHVYSFTQRIEEVENLRHTAQV